MLNVIENDAGDQDCGGLYRKEEVYIAQPELQHQNQSPESTNQGAETHRQGLAKRIDVR